MTDVQILVRGSFRPLPGAQARAVRHNAWTVRVPRTPEVLRTVRRRAIAIDAFDDATFLIGDDESVQAMGERESRDAIWVTVLV